MQLFAALIFCQDGEFTQSNKENHPSHKEQETLSWEKWKKKTGRMQWPLGSDCDTVTFYLEKLSWVANDLLQHQSSRGAPELLWRAEPAPLFSHALSLMVVIASKMPGNCPSPLWWSRGDKNPLCLSLVYTQVLGGNWGPSLTFSVVCCVVLE